MRVCECVDKWVEDILCVCVWLCTWERTKNIQISVHTHLHMYTYAQSCANSRTLPSQRNGHACETKGERERMRERETHTHTRTSKRERETLTHAYAYTHSWKRDKRTYTIERPRARAREREIHTDILTQTLETEEWTQLRDDKLPYTVDMAPEPPVPGETGTRFSISICPNSTSPEHEVYKLIFLISIVYYFIYDM